MNGSALFVMWEIKEKLFCSEVFLQFLGGAAFAVGQVADDDAMLQKGDARRDVDGVLQVMAGDEDGGSRLAVIIGENVLQDILRRGIEEVEGLVEDDRLGVAEEGGDDADLHLVTCREVADELLLAEDLVVGETLEVLEALVNFLLADAGDLAEEGEILLGGEEVDEESIIDIGAHIVFPSLTFCRVDVRESGLVDSSTPE